MQQMESWSCLFDGSLYRRLYVFERSPTTRTDLNSFRFIQFLPIQASENTVEAEYTESEQSKPLLDKSRYTDDAPPTIVKFDKRNSIKRKSIEEAINRPNDACVVPNVEGIELANDAVCPFGLAKNLEKQICIIPSRKKSKFSAPRPPQPLYHSHATHFLLILITILCRQFYFSTKKDNAHQLY